MILNFKNLIIYTILSIGLFSVSSINAVEMPEQIEFQEKKLILNGKGSRVVFFMKVYDGSLYLETKTNDAEKIISSNAPMAIRIDVTSEMVTADAMKKALNDGLEKSTKNNTESIATEIEQLSSTFNSIVNSGDFFEFIFIPEIGMHVLKNNELQQIITGIEFKKAFFGIFLSNDPVQKNLKKSMLGG